MFINSFFTFLRINVDHVLLVRIFSPKLLIELIRNIINIFILLTISILTIKLYNT